MRLVLEETGRTLAVVREPGDKRIKNGSALFHQVRLALLERGFDVIKKEPAKDGHLTSMPYYVRERSGVFSVSDGNYAIRDAAQQYRENGLVVLDLRWHLSAEDLEKVIRRFQKPLLWGSEAT